jgi:hypothetical protein
MPPRSGRTGRVLSRTANGDASGALYVTYTSANCTPLGAGPADMAGGYFGGTGENQRLLDYLGAGSAAARTGLVRMDYPGYALVASIIGRNPGVSPAVAATAPR